MFMCISFLWFSSKKPILTFNSFTTKALLLIIFFIPLIVPNKNWFSSICSLPRSSALPLSYVQAGIHGSHTAHTRLQHTLCSGKHPLKTDCIQLAWVHWQLLVSMAHWDCMQSTTTKDGVTPTFTYWNIYVST